MALVGEPCLSGGLRGAAPAQEQLPRQTDAPLEQIGVRRDPDGTSEAAEELEAAHARQSGEFG